MVKISRKIFTTNMKKCYIFKYKFIVKLEKSASMIR